MSDSKRIKISQSVNEPTPTNVFPDYDWARENRKALLEKYGTGVALIYQHEVVGTGKTLDEAVSDADKRLPENVEQITPIIYLLGNLHRIHRIRASKQESNQ